LFQDKDVLDIGCNIGHVTLIVARDFGARSVVGLDIDRKLIAIARKNVRHYVNYADSPPNDEPGGGGQERAGDSKFFPISMPIVYGPVDIPGISHGQSPSASKKFPHNVTFIQVIS
jgi:7SK snRNA methylphosphate capping enzyme